MGRLRNLAITLRMSLANMVKLNWGFWRGREYVPHPRSHLFIEPTSFCNLECKFCTYRLDRRPRTSMDADRFADVVGQALALGFQDVALTPINGDVFVDKGFLDKLRFLEAGPAPLRVHLYTNFIALSDEGLDQLLGMRKLALLNISVYGHDETSFTAITGRGPEQYRRLVHNLDRLAERLARDGSKIPAFQIGVRTGRKVVLDRLASPLAAAVRGLRDLGVVTALVSRCDDWGGLIVPSDLNGLDMDLVQGRLLYKKGACILPFASVQVLADGRVNACACRDIDGELQIGDLKSQSLSQILSADNAAYMGLIDRQQRGDWPSACRGCSFYRSIHDPAVAGDRPMTLNEFWGFLGRTPPVG